MVKPISHTVRRPGRRPGDPNVDIPVPTELATVPGIPQKPVDVAFYSREHPLESQAVYKSADRQWAVIHQSKDIDEFRKGHDERMEPMYQEGLVSADVEPTGTPVAGEDQTEDIRLFARELGFGEVGFTKHDRHYTYSGKKRWAKFEHAICLAYEQDYRMTQSGPSPEADQARFRDIRVRAGRLFEARGVHQDEGLPRTGPRWIRLQRPVHTNVRRGGIGPARSERPTSVAALRLARQADAGHY